jgi:hypothetical protein
VVDPMEEFFRIQNKLDIELYEYARKRFATWLHLTLIME